MFFIESEKAWILEVNAESSQSGQLFNADNWASILRVFFWVSEELSFVTLETRGVWILDGIDVSLILFDGEISIANSGDGFWEMLLRVFTLPSR